MKFISCIFILLTFIISKSIANESDVTNSFQKNHKLWLENKPNNYIYTLERQCFCPIEYTLPITIEVQDNLVTSAEFVDDKREISKELFSELETIDDWFILIIDAIKRQPDRISIQYNDEYGYPQMIDIDMRLLRSDDEQVVSITNLTLK